MRPEYKYHGQETCDRYLELSRQGCTEVEIAADLGVTTKVFDQWQEKHDEFQLAREEGKAASAAWCMKGMRAKAAGKNEKGSFDALRWLLKNCHGFKEEASVRVGLEAPEGNNIKIEFVNAEPHDE